MSATSEKKRTASQMAAENEDSLVTENRRLVQEIEKMKSKLECLEQVYAQLQVKLAEYEEDGSDADDHSDSEDSVCDGSIWSKKYLILKQFKQENGHCNAPRKHPDLGFFINNMRKAYKAKKLSQEEVDKLNKVGFHWGKGFPEPPSWQDRFHELKKYYDTFGHSNIHVDENPDIRTDLAKWVVEQRKQGKRLQKMKPSSMTMDQYKQLDALSFKWKVPKRRHKLS